MGDTRGPRTLISLALVVVIAVTSSLVTTALATDTFPDVSNGNPFHDAVNGFIAAGCATGFPDGTFRPADPVKRQQMARFFQSCGTRADGDDGELTNITGTFQEITDVRVKSGHLGNVGSGGGSYWVTGEVQAVTSSQGDPNCPCTVSVQIARGATTLVSRSFSLPAVDTSFASGTISTFLCAPPGNDSTFDLDVRRFSGSDGGIDVQGSLTALYIPFSGVGAGRSPANCV